MAKAVGGAEAAEAVETDLGREELQEIYYWLQLTREVEQVLTNLYRQNKVIGGLYRSLGQEAGAVGTAFALRRRTDATGDVMSPAIRDLGAMLMMGADAADVMKQYMAKGDGPTGGRETNVHFSDYEKGYVGLISHLGVMVEVMTGVAMSFRLRKEDRVAMVYSGDGMTSTGAFHEGLNLAAVKKLPLICVVENNMYAYSTPTSRQTAAESFVAKADGYGIRGERVDGNDVGYGTIAAAGSHACVLHWTRNDGPLKKGELLLLDAGVEGNFGGSEKSFEYAVDFPEYSEDDKSSFVPRLWAGKKVVFPATDAIRDADSHAAQAAADALDRRH